MSERLHGTFPDELRIEGAGNVLEAGGRRAHAVAREGGIDVRIDGWSAHLRSDARAPAGDVAVWPFGAASGDARLFVAPEHPVVVYEVRTAGAQLHADPDPRLRVALETVEGGVRAIVHRGDQPPPAADALVASAIARARRRAAQRPAVRAGDEPDPIPSLEHALRLALARNGALPIDARVASALALLALNDADVALHVLREAGAELERDASAALMLTGAWAAWRGAAVPLDAVRAAARASENASPHARALAPFAADVLDPGRAERGAATGDAGAALVEAGSALPEAAAVLIAMHGTLGVMPDAVRARIRFAPRLAAGRTVIERIGAGDAVFRIEARVEAERATIVIDQTDGPTPYRAIVEPRLPAGRIREASVDGALAELDSAVVDGGMQVAVQLVVDQRRTLVLDYERR